MYKNKTFKTFKTMNKLNKKNVAAAQPCAAENLLVGRLSHISNKLGFVCFVGFVIIMTLSGCNVEKKLAKQYLTERPHIDAAVYFPEKAEVKVEYNTELDKKTEVLNGFDQDLFLDVMYNAYAKTMGDYGVNVYVPEDIDSILVDSTHWLVMLSRTEISGRITEYEDYLFSDTDYYSYKHPLNTVNVASWFEVNDGEWKPVLYCEHNLMDGFDSKTDYSIWTQEIDYTYTIDTLKLADVYNYAVYLGKLYAGYTYDYMMNSYVGKEMERQNLDYWNQYLLRYDPYKKQLRYTVEDECFIEIEED